MSGAKRGVCLLVLYYHGGGNNHNNNCKERSQESKQFAPGWLLSCWRLKHTECRRQMYPIQIYVQKLLCILSCYCPDLDLILIPSLTQRPTATVLIVACSRERMR